MPQAVLPSKKIVIYVDSGEKCNINTILEKRCELRSKRLIVADYVLSNFQKEEKKVIEDKMNDIETYIHEFLEK